MIFFLLPTTYTLHLHKNKPEENSSYTRPKVIKENPRSLVEKITRFANFHFYRNFMKHAEIIVAISNYTKQDILELYPTIQPSKIKVIYNSVLLAKDSTSPFRTSVPPNYLLYVNTLQPHKNIITLLKAFNLIKEKIDHQIVIVGKETPYWKEKVVPYIQENQLETTHHSFAESQ